MKLRITSSQQGHTVIFTLVACLVLGVVLLGIMKLANQEGQMTGRSQNWNNAMPIVEAGIEEAFSHLKYSPTNRDQNGWVFDSTVNPPYYTRTRTFQDGYYKVTISTNWNPVITSRAWLRAPAQKDFTITRAVRVRATNQPLFTAALEAPIAVILKGNGTRIDSYDSLDPLHSGPGGTYDPSKAKDGGDVVCYGGPGALNIGNGDINGKIKIGEDTTYTVGANGSVGSMTWNQSGVQPGWSETTEATDYPEMGAPVGGTRPTGGKVETTTYQYILDGNNAVYETDQQGLTGNMLVRGTNISLVVNNTLTIGPKDTITILQNASLKLYVRAADVSFTGGVANQSTDALHFMYFGLTENVSISMGGNSSFRGVIYAPNAILNLNGGGGDAVDLQGAIIAKQVKVNGHYTFHFDEATRRFGSRGIVAASWDEISPADL